MSLNKNLIRKYNIPGPRYTSYPTVPHWNLDAFNQEEWESRLQQSFLESNDEEGISIYVHLPFCESLCTYCGCNTRITVNHEVEKPYIESLLHEYDLYVKLFGKKPKVKEIHYGGGTPTFFSPENLQLLTQGILDRSEVAKDSEFGFEAHPSNTSIGHLKTLGKLGFKRLSLGIQDFDLKVQETINRFQTFEQVKQVTDQARTIGYNSINYDLIFGLPYQTLDGISKTIKQVIQLKPDRIAFYGYAHVPWVKPGQRSYSEKDLPTHEQKRKLYERGRELFEEAGYIEIGMDHFALTHDSLYKAVENGSLHRNFMGYTPATTKVVIGLGVSSIGDCWEAFNQNVKTVEEYKSLVSQNKFPVFKGHLLTDEDIEIRKLILEIMCNMKAKWRMELFDESDLHKRLSEMIKDDLVELNSCALRVKEAGRPFVRNVCMAFDKKLLSSKPKTEIFSSVI